MTSFMPYLHNGLEPYGSFDGLDVFENERSWRGFVAYRTLLLPPIMPDDVQLRTDFVPDFKWFQNYYETCFQCGDPSRAKFMAFDGDKFVATLDLKRWKCEVDVGIQDSFFCKSDIFTMCPGLKQAKDMLENDPLTTAMSWLSAPRTGVELLMSAESDHWERRAALAALLDRSMLTVRDSVARGLAEDHDWHVRKCLAENRFLKDKGSVEIMMHDADWRVRQGLCLGKHYTQGLLMAPLLEDPVFEVRLAAAEVMYHCCWPNEFAGAVTTILDSGCDECIKEAVAMGSIAGE